MTAPLDRIEAALTRLGAEHEPPLGWEARVLAAVRAEQPRRPWWRIAVPVLTLATAAAVALFIVTRPKPFVLDVVAEGSTPVRGAQREPTPVRGNGAEERSLGDVVHIAVSGGTGQRAIRVYRGETDLVLTCPGNRACRVSGDRITVDVTLDKIGHYVIVAVASEDALPATSGNYDADSAAAIKANATLHKRELRVD